MATVGDKQISLVREYQSISAMTEKALSRFATWVSLKVEAPEAGSKDYCSCQVGS